MPIEGEKLDDLLSGYLDDQLNGEELQQVRTELDREESARVRLDEIQQTNQILRQHFRAVSDSPAKLPAGFTSRILEIAEAAKSAKDEAGVVPETIEKSDSTERKLEPLGSSTWQRSVLKIAAMAAAILAIVSLPFFFGGPEKDPASSNQEMASKEDPEASSAEVPSGEFIPDTRLADESASAEEQPVQYVSQLGFGLTYLLVVDVEITQAAAGQQVLQRILAQAGIVENPPIRGNEEVEAAIAESRMTVNENSTAEGTATIYLLRAAIEDLGAALDQIYADQVSFPRVSLDLAFDTPNTRLMQKVARSTGTRFTVNESFAAPLSVEVDNGSSTAIRGIRPPANYVSKEQRETGFGSLPPRGQAASTSLETMLLFVRVVEN